jgi:plasmid maintenance system antidote protein VapI
MNVYLEAEGGARLEDTDFRPLPVGQVIERSLARKDISVEEAAEKAQISPVELTDVIKGRRALERITSRKLQTVFPHTMRLFLNIQRSYQFFEKYGQLRPSSPVERAMVVTGFRRARAR